VLADSAGDVLDPPFLFMGEWYGSRSALDEARRHHRARRKRILRLVTDDDPGE